MQNLDGMKRLSKYRQGVLPAVKGEAREGVLNNTRRETMGKPQGRESGAPRIQGLTLQANMSVRSGKKSKLCSDLGDNSYSPRLL